MHGYGEFRWKDGKQYIGYYTHDKKEGFGIYYWANSNRIYIGFWKGGKQEGIGKYINPKMIRWGSWKNGVRQKWYNSETEALNSLTISQVKYKRLLTCEISEISNFLS
jgi:hypothetical protein